MKVIENKQIDQQVYFHKYSNGLEIILIPKKGFKEKTVMFGTKFGSINNRFVINGQRVDVPDGIAHFLEHKVLEQEDGEDALMTLTSLGAVINAYTTTNHTVYFFDTIDNYDKCTKELFNFVQSPYFTDQNVEKERGIIEQEIQMYDDDEGFQVYINLMENMYKVHPVKIDIGGTIQTIAQIDKELLYKCYNTFYNVSNMLVCICGDIDVEETIKFIRTLVPKQGNKEKVKEFFPVEPKEIANKESVKYMEISVPLLAIGFKDNYVSSRSNQEKITFDIATQIAMDLLIGKSSKLYQKLYTNNLISGSLDLSYTYERDYGYIMIECATLEPEKFMEMFNEELLNFEFNEEDFERIKKTLHGNYILEFNSVPRLARMFFADYTKGINSLDYMDGYKNVTVEDVKSVFDKLMKQENMAISVIKGKKDK